MAFDWNEAAVYNLQSLWRDGVPFSKIAKQLGCPSRNSAIGKAHRLGLRRAEPTKVNRPRPSRKYNPFAARPARRKAEPNLIARAAKQAAKETRAMAKSTPYEGALNIPFLDLKEHHCRYITSGERAEALFCGAPRVAEKAFCAHHFAICYVPGKAR